MNTPSYSLKSGFLYQSEIIGRKYHTLALFLKILWKNLRSAHLYAWRCCRNVVRNCRWRYSIKGRSSQPVLVSAWRSPITYGLRLPTLTLLETLFQKMPCDLLLRNNWKPQFVTKCQLQHSWIHTCHTCLTWAFGTLPTLWEYSLSFRKYNCNPRIFLFLADSFTLAIYQLICTINGNEKCLNSIT